MNNPRDIVKQTIAKKEHNERIMQSEPRKRDGGIRSFAGAYCRRTAIRWSKRGGRGWNDRQVMSRGALLIYARVMTGSKIGVDLCSAVYRRLIISCYKKDLLSALTVYDKSRSAMRDVTYELRDCWDLRRYRAGGGRLLRTHDFIRNKRRLYPALGLSRFTLRFRKIQGFYLIQKNIKIKNT